MIQREIGFLNFKFLSTVGIETVVISSIKKKKKFLRKNVKNDTEVKQVLMKRTELLVTQGKCDIKLNLSDDSILPHLREV